MVAFVTGTTASQALISALLDEPVDDVVKRLRSEGMSWQRIAERIANDTGGVIRLHRETYRLWFTSDGKEDGPT
jgi:hypothetical protein